jgi:son of sevenless-like protein
LSSNVHAAVYSKKVGQSGLSTWAEVMRAASKLKDVISGFPSWIGEGLPRGEQEAILGKRLICHLTVDGVGEIFGGKWGFGQSSLAQLDLSPLNLAAVADLQRLKGSIEGVQQNDDAILDIVRTVTKFTTRASNIDIAIAVDVDGDISQRAREDQGKIYSDTVTKVHSALHDLEKAHLALHSGMIALATADKLDGEVYTTITTATGKTLESIITLLQLSGTQRSLADKHGLRAQIGVRSPRYIPTRPPSVASKISRKSLVRPIRTRGLDEEDEDLAAMASERRDAAGEMAPTSAGGISASASQTSLSRRDPMSATSSTTSLAYQQTDSDGGSIRGKRSSIMNFMKGRSSEETSECPLPWDIMRLTGVDRGTRGRGVSKKLAKLLGEDPQWIHSVPPPQSAGMMTPQHVIPESPWFLGEDYSAEDIVFDDKGGVRAGTLRGLIARLTPHGQTGESAAQCKDADCRSLYCSLRHLVFPMFPPYLQVVHQPPGIVRALGGKV